MKNLVVARYRDGRMVKGISLDVDPAKPTCHVRPTDGPAVEVRLDDLKALFFVRSLDGNPEHREDQVPDPGDPRRPGLTLVHLRFPDGEVVNGFTIRHPPNRPFFYVLPVDQRSNNVRILVNRAAVEASEAL